MSAAELQRQLEEACKFEIRANEAAVQLAPYVHSKMPTLVVQPDATIEQYVIRDNALPDGQAWAHAVSEVKLYDRKTPLTAADLMNDRVVPFFEEHEIVVSHVLTDRGTEFCGKPQHHEYVLYPAIENIDHTRTKARNPQTNGICERFHKTLLDEFYRIAFRKKLYRSIADLQRDLDAWLVEYNETRPHQGRWCYGKMPLQTFIDTLPVAKEKLMQAA